jgi:hypothetical protein
VADGGRRRGKPDGVEDGIEHEAGSRGQGNATQSIPATGTERWYPAVAPVGNGGSSRPEVPLVFDESHPADSYREDPSTPGASVSRADRAQRHALASMNRRPRRGTTVMVGVIVVVVFAALAFLGSRRSPSTGGTHAAAPPSATTRSSGRATHVTSTTAAHSGSSRRGDHTGHSGQHGPSSKPPATTLPTHIVAAFSAPGVATYPVSTESYVVTVTTSAPCWVLAKTASSGSTLWTGTLQAGAHQSIPATGTTTLELGAPSASLSVEQVPVVLPSPLHTPFVATFQPVTPTTGSTSTVPAGTATTG